MLSGEPPVVLSAVKSTSETAVPFSMFNASSFRSSILSTTVVVLLSVSNAPGLYEPSVGEPSGISSPLPTVAPPPPAIEMSIVSVSGLYANVFPAPTKFSALTGPVVIAFPAELIPKLNPPVAVTMPEILRLSKASPQERFPSSSVIRNLFDSGVAGKV